MSEPRIEPHRVTKPIQLLAAWLAGLVLVDAAFLGAAATVIEPSWASGALVIASIINVPLFVGCIFVLQTRYRAEMQEDTYYSKYLDTQTRTTQSAAMQDETALRAEIFQSESRILEILESLQDRLASFMQSEIDVKGKQELSELMDRASASITDAKQRAQWERYILFVNDLLPAYDRIRDALFEASIPVNKLFGTTSVSPRTPKIGILSFGHDVEFSAIKTLVHLLEKHGIEYISYSTHNRDEARIVIGAYIYDYGDDTYAPITGDLADALTDPTTTTESFVNLVRDRAPRTHVESTQHAVPAASESDHN